MGNIAQEGASGCGGFADEARVDVAIRYSELRAVVEALTGEPLSVLLERLREERELTDPAG